jgi:hypothetical protein
MIEHPELGYETNFLGQLAWKDGAAARLVSEKQIKIVHNGGALSPRGLAVKIRQYLRRLKIKNLKVAWVGGDDVRELVRNSGERYRHLDAGNGETLFGGDRQIVSANVYIGQQPIIAALNAGADIVVCGRCCDASPVMGLASWWHGWDPTADYDQLAGSLMAGHLIECGPYVTGGNYCRAAEVAKPYRSGYPIAEIDAGGRTVITKPEGSNGAVTVDTVKSQYLYEIQGPCYLNPDVVMRLDQGVIRELSPDRVEVSGLRGLPPPATAKLAVMSMGGYQCEIYAYVAGLDTDQKIDLMRSQILGELDMTKYTVVSIEPYGVAAMDARTQAKATVPVRIFVQAPTRQAVQDFRLALFYNGQQGCCGLHLGMDWRTLDPKPYMVYFPGLISQAQIKTHVHLLKDDDEDGKVIDISPLDVEFSTRLDWRESYETENPVSLHLSGQTTVNRPLGQYLHPFIPFSTMLSTVLCRRARPRSIW